MKTLMTTVILAGLLFCGSLSLTAQPQSGNPGGPGFRDGAPGERGAPGRHGMMMKRLANKALSDDEKEILKNARLAVMEDEEVKAAREAAKEDPAKRAELRTLMHDKLIMQDPAIPGILQKMKDAAKEMRGNREERQEKLGQLTPDEREALREARAAAKDDPQVQAARETLKETVRAAMVQAKPEVEAILDKLDLPGDDDQA